MRNNLSPLPQTLLLGILAAGAVQAQALGDYEAPPTLVASDILESEQLRGPHWVVDERVQNDGLMNHFVVHSDFGDFEAESDAMLQVRLQEIAAIAKLQEISKSEAFADILKSSALAPVKAAEQIVTHPVQTVKALPGGINRAARGLFYKSRKTAHRVGETVKKEKEEEDDQPSGAEAQDSTAAGAGVSEEGENLTDMAGKEIQDQVGYTGARRDLAARLKVDPYSSNEVLQQELSRVAQGAFLGGLTFRFTLPAVRAIGYVEDLNELVWNVSPDELERRNNKALADIGIPKNVRLDFFDDSVLTPTLETALTGVLVAMDEVTGREHLLELAAAAENRAEARRLVLAAAILAKVHSSSSEASPPTGSRRSELEPSPRRIDSRELDSGSQVSGVKASRSFARIEVLSSERFGELVLGIDGDGRYVLPGVADYLIWQPGMSGGPLEGLTDKELWLSGEISPRARSELESRGWTVRTRVLRPPPGG